LKLYSRNNAGAQAQSAPQSAIEARSFWIESRSRLDFCKGVIVRKTPLHFSGSRFEPEFHF
jgi:hypothetical protein